MKLRRPKLENFTRDLGLKIFSLIIAILVWFHATTEKTYTHYVTIRLAYSGLPKNLFVLNELPKEAKARVRGRGKDLILLSLMKLRAQIDLTRIRPGRNYKQLSPQLVITPYEGKFRIEDVEPKKIEIIADKLERKRVRVRIVTKNSPPKGYAFMGATYRGRVYLYGPSQIIRDYREVKTDTIDLSGRKKTFTQKVRLIPPYKDSWLKPESVTVTVKIEKIAERTVENVSVKYTPSRWGKVILKTEKLKVKVAGPERKVKKLTSNDIKAYLNLRNYKKGEYKLKPIFTLPKGIEIRDWEPSEIEVVIR